MRKMQHLAATLASIDFIVCEPLAKRDPVRIQLRLIISPITVAHVLVRRMYAEARERAHRRPQLRRQLEL